MDLDVAEAAPVKSPSSPMTYVLPEACFPLAEDPDDPPESDESDEPEELDPPLQAAAVSTSNAAAIPAQDRRTVDVRTGRARF
jgi:hypothetical protein